jgi:hypothetical protein
MSLKETFTSEEWIQLEKSVVWIFLAIAGADKKIDKNELDALTEVRKHSNNISNELAKEIISTTDYSTQNIHAFLSKDQMEIRRELRELSDLLELKLKHNESLLFKKTLLAIGTYIANASGDALLPNISNEELQTLTEISLYMRISRTEIREEPNIIDIYKKLFIPEK